MTRHMRQRLRTTSSVRKNCVVSGGQLVLFDLVYGSDDLVELTDLYGDDLTVMAHLAPDDLSQVGVEHPVDGHIVLVPCLQDRDVRRLPILAHLDWLARTSPDTVIRVRDELLDGVDDRRRTLCR